MITNIEITGVGGYILDDSTRKYIAKRIGRLDRLVLRKVRKEARAEVKVERVNRDHGNKYEVEAILILPERRILARDSTMNVLAATDIVEAKLAAQLRKLKQVSIPHVGRRKMLDQFKRSYARES